MVEVCGQSKFDNETVCFHYEVERCPKVCLVISESEERKGELEIWHDTRKGCGEFRKSKHSYRRLLRKGEIE